MKTVSIKGKEYVEVNERIKHFRANYKDWSLESELVSNDNGVCVIKAVIKNPDGVVKATGYAYEKENSTFINKTSYIENCETSAWGRALGNLGIGIDTSIASAEEVQNAIENQKDESEEHIKNIQLCSDRSELELYWASLTDFEKKNPKILKAFKEMGIKYPKVELVRDENSGKIKEVIAE